MPPVTVFILHPEPAPTDGPLVRALATARLELARRHERGFREVGADEVRLVTGRPDDTTFGRRVRDLVGSHGRSGIVVLGSGAMALADRADLRAFVEVARSGARRVLANNRHSADVVALGRADLLDGIPDLRSDNVLPRWLAAGIDVRVDDLARRRRLAIDLDSPLDVLLVARSQRPPTWARRAAEGLPGRAVDDCLDRLSRIAADPTAELLVAGRTSSSTLAWFERRTASRTRALVEERGLRASEPVDGISGPRRQRAPRSILGAQLDRVGPAAFGALVSTLADGALIDVRVLLAHRHGPDESGWPSPEDRYAADLLAPQAIADPWLRDLTRSALEATVPIALGGHTLVGPGAPLALRPRPMPGRPSATGRE